MTKMPKQIQDCHDKWAATLDGQMRVLAVEVTRAQRVFKLEMQGLGDSFRAASVSARQLGIEIANRLTQGRRKR